MTEKVTIKPNCRYGHGDLVSVTLEGKPHRWGLISLSEMNVFSGDVYVCPKCGYIEMFDDDVAKTLKPVEPA